MSTFHKILSLPRPIVQLVDKLLGRLPRLSRAVQKAVVFFFYPALIFVVLAAASGLKYTVTAIQFYQSHKNLTYQCSVSKTALQGCELEASQLLKDVMDCEPRLGYCMRSLQTKQ